IQAVTVQVTEENKKGACPYTDKKRKAEKLEKREKSRKNRNGHPYSATPSTSETYAEQISTESDMSYNKIERTPVGLEGLTDNCFFENIDDMIGLSEWKTEDRNPYS
ncbi:13710_t:CDS:2, partial [Gigaspora margarita]